MTTTTTTTESNAASTKKAAPKGKGPVALQTTKKGAKAAKGTKGKDKEPKERKRGLSENQVLVLEALAKSKSANGMTRAQLREATGIQKGFSSFMGAATLEGFGAAKETALEPMGLVKSAQYEGERSLFYTITAAGKTALAAAKAKAKAKE